MLDLIVLHGEFSIFTVRGNFWYQIYRNRRKKVLCSRLSLITLTILHRFNALRKLSLLFRINDHCFGLQSNDFNGLASSIKSDC